MLAGRLSFATVALLVLMCGCQDGEETPPSESRTPATSAGASVSPSVPPGSTGSPDAAFESFRDHASRTQDAVQSQDTNFFIDNAVLGSLECPNELQGDCGFPYPTTIVGIRVGLWRSEGTVQPPDEFRQTLGDYLASNPRLYALAALNRDAGGGIGGPAYYAILNSIAAPSETTVALQFINDGGAWRFSLYLNARTPDSSTSEWLSGTCSECYDYWETWEET
jgi:hypothetical protein